METEPPSSTVPSDRTLFFLQDVEWGFPYAPLTMDSGHYATDPAFGLCSDTVVAKQITVKLSKQNNS